MTSHGDDRAAASDRPTVLIVDDEEQIRRLVMHVLTQEGMRPLEAAEGTTALAVMKREQPDLVVLDVLMPGLDGLDLLQQIRRTSEVPVIMLTGRGHEVDRIVGLRSGADDYVVKPFLPGELAARISAVLRRTRKSPTPDTVTFGELTINIVTREVVVRGEAVDLTAKEFDLLAFLVASPRQVFTRDQLLEHVWQSSSEWQDSATVTEHIRRVRRKIEIEPENPRWLKTVRGVGYRFEP
jgi:two-component system alkaline phosphatase synthesis response regulator PhoP